MLSSGPNAPFTLGSFGLDRVTGLAMLVMAPFIFHDIEVRTDQPEHIALWVVLGLATCVFGYWLAVGVLNRWHIHVDARGVHARWGPLPTFTRSVFVPRRSIRRFVMTDRLGPWLLLGSAGPGIAELDRRYSIHVEHHARGVRSRLVWSCTNERAVIETTLALNHQLPSPPPGRR